MFKDWSAQIVQTFVRVLDIERFDIILGRPFIQQYGILHKIISISQHDTKGKALLVIQERHSDDAKSLVDHNINSNRTTAVESTPSVIPPSHSDATTDDDTALSASFSEVSQSESSSIEDENDSDEDSVIEIDVRPTRISIPPGVLAGFENEEYLTSLMRLLRQALVERLMAEVWGLLNQERFKYTRKCLDTSESTTTSQSRPKDQPSALGTTELKNKKRTWDNGDDENPDGDDKAPPKRPKSMLDQRGVLDFGNNFACPYRKYDPRKYCAHSQNRKWRSCAVTPFADVSRVKYVEP